MAKSTYGVQSVSIESLMNRKVQLAFVSAILTLLLVGIISYRALVTSTESERWVQHTHEVLENLQAMLFDIQTLEGEARGYVLLGSAANMGDFDTNMAIYRQHQAAVRTLTQDNPIQQQVLPELDRLMAQKIDVMLNLIAVRREKGPDAALALLRDPDRPRLMRQIKKIVFQMEDEERLLLKQRNAEAERQLSQARTILIFGSLLGLAIASIAAWSVHRESRQRAMVEIALRKSEGKFRGLLEAAPDALVVVTETGQIVLLNLEAEQQFGYRRAQLVGQNIRKILPSGLDSQLASSQQHSTNQPSDPENNPGRLFELIGTRSNHSEFPVELLLSPLDSSEGLLFTVSIRNITERKLAEQELARITADLRRSNTELQQLAYVASHDLQEPLRAVASYTQLIARRYKGHLDKEADEFIAFAVDGCTRMKALIQDLLSYSRAGGNDGAGHFITADQALREALGNLRLIIEETKADVTHDPMADLGLFDSRLTRVFQNLVSNAIKYRGDDAPVIQITAKRGVGTECLFTVRDNGIGIDPQYFEKIFFLFQRLHGPHQFKGTGIGLSICEKILHHLGGRIWVDSQLGKGSSFHFALPAKPTQTISADSTPEAVPFLAFQTLAPGAKPVSVIPAESQI